jgi:hypothetical protein
VGRRSSGGEGSETKREKTGGFGLDVLVVIVVGVAAIVEIDE